MQKVFGWILMFLVTGVLLYLIHHLGKLLKGDYNERLAPFWKQVNASLTNLFTLAGVLITIVVLCAAFYVASVIYAYLALAIMLIFAAGGLIVFIFKK